MMTTRVPVALAAALLPVPALAGTTAFSLVSDSRSASTKCVRSGGGLPVTLTELSTSDESAPTDLLSAVNFPWDGNPALAIVPALDEISS